ncbi:MAG: TIGR04086 family membrane protein [Clostridia bacterium]|jgi:putative membrane protein (TIGR04086 family)|nr:TIGR04086 family membrane protein [Clostridia bacterium]
MSIKAVWLGIILSVVLWLAGAVLGVAWLLINGEGFYWFSVYIYLMGLAGAFAGGFSAGGRSEKRGWEHGLCVGVVLGLLGALVNLELAPLTFTWSGVLRQLVVWALWGMLGGYLGFSVKKRPQEAKIYQRRTG